jgi:hypothetical protein
MTGILGRGGAFRQAGDFEAGQFRDSRRPQRSTQKPIENVDSNGVFRHVEQEVLRSSCCFFTSRKVCGPEVKKELRQSSTVQA